ncbi:hypothetical protein DPMN_166404 [Dreissena polymorpha]|uniref:Uncharacterized protein n=1 Tax=Dreissena polymorpha TaxID=45954 RepID=A0A9D4IXD0_DREPO|nr:hypothetical protein DPMN_166404 [Dreissena polymorpha]
MCNSFCGKWPFIDSSYLISAAVKERGEGQQSGNNPFAIPVVSHTKEESQSQ